MIGMSRQFKPLDYEATLDTSVRLGDCLPPTHLARFVVDIVAQLDLQPLYARYGSRGGAPYPPQMMIALLVYAYATGVFSSRKIEQATQETAAFRFLAGNYSPDHDTIAAFRKQFLPQLKDLFVQILLLAQEMGLLELGNISLDGTKIHADASKSKAVSHKRLLEIELFLQAEVNELLALAQKADSALPEGMNLPEELARRQDRLQRLAEAKAVIEARAAERHAAEQADYDAKLAARADKEQQTGKKPRGKPPTPPTPGPAEGDQYNFTDPQSRIMKNSRDGGFSQQYNGQVAVDHDSRLIVGFSLSNHANDQHEVEPTLANVPDELGHIQAAALDTGYFSEANLKALAAQEIDAYIATGRDPHHQGWRAYFAEAGEAPEAGARPKEKMAHKLRTATGKAIYRLRKCTVEPVIGILKEAMGFRQFSLRGQENVTGEWCLVCLAYNLRRLHVLQGA
jgi:transposase